MNKYLYNRNYICVNISLVLRHVLVAHLDVEKTNSASVEDLMQTLVFKMSFFVVSLYFESSL